jgi:hypothetical protein
MPQPGVDLGWIRLFLLGLGCWLLSLSCARSFPPEIPDFKPPPEPVAKEEIKPRLAADTAEAVEEAEPEPQPEAERPVVKEEALKPPEPEPEPEAAAVQAPTLVGTWRVVEMSKDGETAPGFDQMEMTFTFTEDGTITMTVSSSQMPESHTQEGSYALADGQITITMRDQAKTGTCTFEGNNRVILEVDGGRLTLDRI